MMVFPCLCDLQPVSFAHSPISQVKRVSHPDSSPRAGCWLLATFLPGKLAETIWNDRPSVVIVGILRHDRGLKPGSVSEPHTKEDRS